MGVLIDEQKPSVIWYLYGEPGNLDTNELIAREIPTEYAHRDVKCADGKQRNLWQCPLGIRTVRVFEKMREATTLLRFTVWMKIGDLCPQRWSLRNKEKYHGRLKRKIKNFSSIARSSSR